MKGGWESSDNIYSKMLLLVTVKSKAGMCLELVWCLYLVSLAGAIWMRVFYFPQWMGHQSITGLSPA